MKNKFLIGASALTATVSLICLVWVAIVHMRQNKIVYIDTIRLFNEYNLKIDLERKAEGKLLRLKNEIDSAAAVVKVAIDQKADQKDVRQLQHQFLLKKREVEEVYARSNDEINQTVWGRLNPLINRYGKENDLELIIGANGMGTVLYGRESKDETAHLIDFINSEYEKGH